MSVLLSNCMMDSHCCHFRTSKWHMREVSQTSCQMPCLRYKGHATFYCSCHIRRDVMWQTTICVTWLDAPWPIVKTYFEKTTERNPVCQTHLTTSAKVRNKRWHFYLTAGNLIAPGFMAKFLLLKCYNGFSDGCMEIVFWDIQYNFKAQSSAMYFN